MKTLITLRKFTGMILLSLVIIVFQLPATGQTSHQITAQNTYFDPDEITIQPGDTVIWKNVQGFHNVDGLQSTFPDNPESFGNDVGADWTFSHVFTVPGTNHYQCDPHASLGMKGKVIVLEPSPDTLTVVFSAMTPHIGQTLWLAVYDAETGEEIGRTHVVVEENFTVSLPGIMNGHSYRVDFFADFNENGVYDAPPADHAWRMELNDVSGNDTLRFTHNTNFTDIRWMYRLRVRFMDMNPHLGQMLTLFVREASSGDYLDTLVVPSIEQPDFDVKSFVIEPGGSYMIDFYADFNENGMYDPPPADHAWRLMAENVTGDVDLDFTHNTNFTDIFASTGIKENIIRAVSVFPNPANRTLYLKTTWPPDQPGSLSVISPTGKLLIRENFDSISEVSGLDIHSLPEGLYFLEIRSASGKTVVRFVKE